MSKRSQFQNQKPQKPHAARPPLVRPPLEIRQAKAAVVYGKPFVLLEDANRATFQFLRGPWVPYPKKILPMSARLRSQAVVAEGQ